MKHLFLFFISSLLLLACGTIQRKQQFYMTTQFGASTKDSTFEKNHSLSTFSNLNVQLENISIFIFPSSKSYAKIICNEETHQKIKILQEGENLTLSRDKNSSEINDNHRVIISLYTPNIKSVKLKSGFIEINNFDDLNELETTISGCGTIRILYTGFSSSINHLTCTINGSGKIFTDGKIDVMNGSFTIAGDGEINVKSSQIKKASTTINGKGYIYITPLESLNGSINGAGYIYYFGKSINPAITINGCGKVIANEIY